MKTSDAFKDGEPTPEETEGLDDEQIEALVEAMKFPWKAKEGITGQTVFKDEFN